MKKKLIWLLFPFCTPIKKSCENKLRLRSFSLLKQKCAKCHHFLSEFTTLFFIIFANLHSDFCYKTLRDLFSFIIQIQTVKTLRKFNYENFNHLLFFRCFVELSMRSRRWQFNSARNLRWWSDTKVRKRCK